MKTRSFPTLFFSLALISIATTQADWPQWRGPNGNGIVNETIIDEFPAEGPRVLWRRPVKLGFSSFVLEDQLLATITLRGDSGVPIETCLALDPATGRELWATPLTPGKYTGVGYDSGNYGAPGNMGGDGPRSTPAISDGRVYVTSSALVIFCLDGADGRILWKRDLIAEHKGEHIYYENAASPMIHENTLLLAGGGPGESILGLNKDTGEVNWKSHSEQLTHSTPALTAINDIGQAIFYTRTGLLSLDPTTGHRLWHYPFPFRVSAAITPVVDGNLVYCSAGYGIGSGVCNVSRKGSRFSATEVWRLRHNEPVANYWSTPVVRQGHLFGIFGFKKYGIAPLKCVDLKTGSVKWTQPGFGHGNVIAASNLLLAITSAGELVLVEPATDRYQERARAKILTGKCWSTPVLSQGRLFARSTKEAVCIDLSPIQGAQPASVASAD